MYIPITDFMRKTRRKIMKKRFMTSLYRSRAKMMKFLTASTKILSSAQADCAELSAQAQTE